MPFNSYPYIVLLLAVVSIYVLLEARWPSARRVFLLIVSYGFYAWWRADFLTLLLGSTAVNYVLGAEISRRVEAKLSARFHLVIGVVFNLGLLGVFKYAGMFAETANLLGFHIPVPQFFLPLAISFFTFEQISYLVDAKAGIAPRYSWLDYALFVAFFPHLISGPIVRYNDLIPQFHATRTPEARNTDISVGVTLFTIGLAKKTLIADNLSPFVDVIFAAAKHGDISTGDAWMGAIFFMLQIYFDFSAYSDMALASACMLGIRLPVNFNSPYKSQSIVEFWRRWHITLQRFILDYLYTPIAVAMTRRALKAHRGRWATFVLAGAFPLWIVFMASGLWHGAWWNFVVFGLMHGIYITINEAWRLFRGKKKSKEPDSWLTRAAGIGLTFIAILFADVMFRAGEVSAALRVYAAMFGMGGTFNPITFTPLAAGAIVALLGIVWFAPNSMEITWAFNPALKPPAFASPIRDIGAWHWAPSRRSAVATGVLAIAAMLALSNLSPFIYFQF
jgi:D-alanyl-lipoteichoic acid acyltransferase DltB (MBOAT superfamily)